MPSHASTVSPAGTVGAFGLGAGPHTPLGYPAAGRGDSPTPVTEKVCGGWSSLAIVSVSVESRVAEYIGATPRPGAATVVFFGPPGPARVRCSVGTVVTNVAWNSGATRNGCSLLPSGGLSCPPLPDDLPATCEPRITVAWVTWASLSPRRYFLAKSPACSARSVGSPWSPNSKGTSKPHTLNWPWTKIGGPDTSMETPRDSSRSTVPNSSQMVIPTSTSAYADTKNQKGSKNTIASPPKASRACAGPKCAATSIAAPAISASEHSAKYTPPTTLMLWIGDQFSPTRGTTG